MRRFVLFALLLSLAALCGLAQDAPKTLSLPQSLFAIKITDPLRQLTAFQPLITRIDELVADLRIGDKVPSEELRKGLTDLAKVPGVDATGDFWIVVFPPDVIPPAKAGDKAVAENPLAPFMPNYAGAMLIPVKDAAQLKQLAAADPQHFKDAQIFDNYAVFGEKLPKFADVDARVTLSSKRDIVMLVNPAKMSLPDLGGDENPMGAIIGTFMGAFSSYFDRLKQNQQRAEYGLSMVGDDLSMEGFVTPVPESPLAKSLAAHQPTDIAVTLAGYLPENLAFCSASAPMLEGAAGTGYEMTHILFSLLGSFLEGDAGKALNARFEKLTAQCVNGRAIGMTVPPKDGTGAATLVAVYQVQKPQEAAAAMHAFVEELIRARNGVMGGMLTDVIKIFSKPNNEMIEQTPVDLMRLIISTGDATAKPISLEMRVAYTNDKMLVAMGEGSKAEITAMIGRVKGRGAGFTAGKRFIALKAGLPADMRGFESFSGLDICRAGASLMPLSPQEKTQFTAFLKIFPEHRNVIHDYQAVREGRLYSEIRIPGEQLDFISSLITSAKVLGELNPKAKENPAAPPAKK